MRWVGMSREGVRVSRAVGGVREGGCSSCITVSIRVHKSLLAL